MMESMTGHQQFHLVIGEMHLFGDAVRTALNYCKKNQFESNKIKICVQIDSNKDAKKIYQSFASQSEFFSNLLKTYPTYEEIKQFMLPSYQQDELARDRATLKYILGEDRQNAYIELLDVNPPILLLIKSRIFS